MENKFEKANNLYFGIKEELKKLRSLSEEALKDAVASNGGAIDLSECDDSVCISYDGGRHPEYNSNCYSDVYSVKLGDNGELAFEIAESDCYEAERVPTLELYGVCGFVHDYIIKG